MLVGSESPLPKGSFPAKGERFGCSWSGGKDSCLALHRATAGGAIPEVLLTVFTEDETRTRSHGLHRSVIEAQAEALGLELRTLSTSWDAYRESLVALLEEARRDGMGSVVFGDIDIDAHRDWELAVAGDAGMKGALPLWGSSRRDVLEDWWRQQFEARRLLGRRSARRLKPARVSKGVVLVAGRWAAFANVSGFEGEVGCASAVGRGRSVDGQAFATSPRAIRVVVASRREGLS